MNPPKKYKDIVNEAIKIDNRLYELRIEDGPRDSRRPYYGTQGYHFKQRDERPYGDPMDLDLMHQREGLGAGRRNTRGRGRGGYRNNNKERDR